MKEKSAGKQKKWMKLVVLIVGVLIALCFLTSGIFYYSVMRKHINTFENAKGLASFSEFEKDGLMREESSFLSDQGKKLCGYFYRKGDGKEYKGVIIVNNGFGAGHEGMLGEINELTEQGYLVYGFDKTGYDKSEGAGIGSLSQGVNDLKEAIHHVRKDPFVGDMKIILYGKSYGAYCCLAVLNDTDDVFAVISMSAFNRPSDMLTSEAERMVGNIGKIFVPSLKLFNAVNEKKRYAMDGLKKTDAHVLIMQGDDDEVVRLEDSYMKFKKACADKRNVTFILYKNKGHNLMASEESIAFNQQMDEDVQVFADQHDGKMSDKLWDEFLSGYDLRKGMVPDKQVVHDIIEFLSIE